MWCAALALLGATLPVSRGWAPGEVCAGVLYNGTSATAARDMLRGKHLKVLDLWWGPFAIPDETAAKGWTGLDVDLLDRMAWLLGFTYEIHDMGYPGDGETWTDHVLNWQHNGDLIAVAHAWLEHP